jgi:hypothetical protein
VSVISDKQIGTSNDNITTASISNWFWVKLALESEVGDSFEISLWGWPVPCSMSVNILKILSVF